MKGYTNREAAVLGRFFDLFTGNNRESLANFIRRMLRELLNRNPDAPPSEDLDIINILGFEQLINSIPGTIMKITEQHDLLREQGLDTESILQAIHSHRQTFLATLNEGYALEATAPTESLPAFILHIIKRELHETGPFRVTEDYIDHVIHETREFARKNPRNTIHAMTRRMWHRHSF